MPVWIRSLSVMLTTFHAMQTEIVFVLVRSVAAPPPAGQEQTHSVAVSEGHEPAAPEPLRLRSTRSYRHLAPPVSPRHTLAESPAERDACNPLCIGREREKPSALSQLSCLIKT